MQIHFLNPIDHVSPAMQVAMFVVHAAHFAGFIILLVQFINIMTQVTIAACPSCLSMLGLSAFAVCAAVESLPYAATALLVHLTW